ncbi:SWIM zinc finger domain-containing protein [Rhodococcus sp. Z13]|uniref:SWIM zinc finger domain-containing protein n=1 Tax=Rhodococcus sacchari TaxID=2962047 RepID=A0ACD4DBK0_9NOCA|nr:SWIM zinc finger family protein [Rhodococcus sp. Z13]UYP17423.1 SWIM zinc finger domain-containing protein [Rhodococcus sp. Z13]
MTAPWTPARIAAVAPDPSSMTAARGVASAWLETGRDDTVLWGRCRGRGTEPYRTAVDPAGPAYTCSCPSRKIPCKHALSLLVRWSEGAVPVAEAPAFVTGWIASRSTAVPVAEPDAAPVKAPDPEAARRRTERIAAGLEELGRWLTDRIRLGLGAVDHDPAVYDAMAARMVDAQAPGVAAALRALAAIVATEPDWPARLLTEYARLHLMVVAFRERDELPAALARSLDTHLGISTRAEDVRAQAPVRDRWQVLATAVTEEGRLFTRRIRLRGRTTGRWATVLDFAHGTARFTTPSPDPGILLDADLHFYPGAAPVRAVMGRQHSASEPFTTLTGTDLDTALDEYARMRGADPWLRSWPVLLDAVVPVDGENGWCVIDGSGRALPLASDDSRWRLLALAGGYPVTLCGEWDGIRLTPVSVFARGEVVCL